MRPQVEEFRELKKAFNSKGLKKGEFFRREGKARRKFIYFE
jgi:hypothetical protein